MKIPAKFADPEVLYKAYLAERKLNRDNIEFYEKKIDDLKWEVAELRGDNRPADKVVVVDADGNVHTADKIVERDFKKYAVVEVKVRHTSFDGRGQEVWYETKKKYIEVK